MRILEPVFGVGETRVLGTLRLRDAAPLHPLDVAASIDYYEARARNPALTLAERVDGLWVLSGRLEAHWTIDADLAAEILTLMRGSSDGGLRRRVFWSLVGRPFPAVRVAALDTLIHDSDWQAREGAVRALRLWRDDPISVAALERAKIADSSAVVRKRAADVLDGR